MVHSDIGFIVQHILKAAAVPEAPAPGFDSPAIQIIDDVHKRGASGNFLKDFPDDLRLGLVYFKFAICAFAISIG